MEKRSSGEILHVPHDSMATNHLPNGNDKQEINEVFGEKDAADIKVFTLNCWGLKFLSKKRVERMEAIGHYLSTSDYDIVLLQEVWTEEDFETICKLVRDAFPFGHHFNQGIIGSGTCILSRVPLQDANFHEFAMNGYPTSLLHGDWYAAKGVGVCQIDLYGFNIHVFVSHYHAEYNAKNDVYLGHRIIHALESAQWIKLTSSSADLTIYGGDFNTEPSSTAYELLRAVSCLSDAWVENGNEANGETNETSYNTFTQPNALAKRIDYIMYRAGPGHDAKVESCRLPLSPKVPNRDYSYSDHEGVAATIRLQRSQDVNLIQTGPKFRRSLTMKYRENCVSAAKDALVILERSIGAVRRNNFKYLFYCIIILILLILSYLPSVMSDSKFHLYLDIGFLFPRLVLTILLVVNFLMAVLFNKKEVNALQESSEQLNLILHHGAGS